MRLLWIDINASYSHSSLALPALHSQLTEEQSKLAEWRVASGTINSDPASLLLEIAEFNPDIILSTVWLFNHIFVLNLLSKFKKLHPDSVVILGGPEFLEDNHNFLCTNKFIDAVFRGEGEEVFPALFDSIICNCNDSWKSICGVCSLDSSGVYHDNGEAVVKDFTKLNIPEISVFFNWEKPFVQIETSRGCFNNCSFCVSGRNRRVQNISPDDIKERLDFIRSKGIKEVRVLDRTFNANPKRAADLLEIFARYHGSITFHLEIHPAFLVDEFKEKLRNMPAGRLHLEAGLQSLDNKVLKVCKRAGSSEKSIDGIKYIVSLQKFELHIDLIAGLPLYTYSQVIKDIKSLISVGADEIQVELLKLLPGTELREKSDDWGIVYSSFPPYEVLRTDVISQLELYKISVLSKVFDIWYNNNIWRKTFSNIISLNDDFIEVFLEYIINNQLLVNPLSLENKGILLLGFCFKHLKDAVPDIAATWIEAGLSLKKGPGKLAKQWIRGVSDKDNPLFDEAHRFFNYYYIEEEGREFWYAFDKRDKKGKPVKLYKA